MALPVSKAGVKISQLTGTPGYTTSLSSQAGVQSLSRVPIRPVAYWADLEEDANILRDSNASPWQYTRKKIHAVRYIHDRQEIEQQASDESMKRPRISRVFRLPPPVGAAGFEG